MVTRFWKYPIGNNTHSFEQSLCSLILVKSRITLLRKLWVQTRALSFRRSLTGDPLIQNEPLSKIHALSLTNSSDVVFWVLKKKAKFLLNLYIKWLEKDLAGANYMRI
jgi:hypothetical protein